MSHDDLPAMRASLLRAAFQIDALQKSLAEHKALLIPALAYCDTNSPYWLAQVKKLRAIMGID